MQDFLTLARDRWSCRSFDGEPVDPAILDRVLEAARLAPTGVNFQPFHLWVFEGEAADKMRELTPCHFGAGTMVLVGADPEQAWTRDYDGLNLASIDGAIVGTHLMLAAASEGLDSCWVCKFDAPAVKEVFPETAPYELVGLFPLGHGDEKAKPAPRHGIRKSLDELVTRL